MKTMINQPNKFGCMQIIFAKQGINVHIVDFFKGGFLISLFQNVCFVDYYHSIIPNLKFGVNRSKFGKKKEFFIPY